VPDELALTDRIGSRKPLPRLIVGQGGAKFVLTHRHQLLDPIEELPFLLLGLFQLPLERGVLLFLDRRQLFLELIDVLLLR